MCYRLCTTCIYKSKIKGHMKILPAETGTLVINPNVTNMLYVTAALNCVKI